MDAIARVQITLQDRDRNDGAVHWNIPSSVTFDDVIAALLSTGLPRIAALSDATFTRMTVTYRHTVNAPALAPIGSSTHRKLMVFVRNADQDLDMISVPSPIASLFESTGAYAGIRALPAELLDLLDLLDLLPFVTRDGRILGIEYAAGALAY